MVRRPKPPDKPITQYWAYLRLDKDHELIFDITVHGEGARSPLSFSLCIDFDKLAGLENAVTNLENAIKQNQDIKQAHDNLLQALNNY